MSNYDKLKAKIEKYIDSVNFLIAEYEEQKQFCIKFDYIDQARACDDKIKGLVIFKKMLNELLK